MHYTGTVWRPPYEASSLLIEVTAGCTHHKCKFCTLYDDFPFKFRMTPPEDMEADLKEAKEQFRLWNYNRAARVFLVGANPFVLSAARLLETAALICKYFPDNKSIGCFSRITDITLKTDGELAELQRAGYDGLTIGIETGDNEALRFMNKGYEAQDILTQCRRLDKAGISYNFFYLTGISGAGKGEKGAYDTAAICNQLQPKVIGANMLTIYKNAELYQEIQNGNWQEETEIEKYKELRAFKYSCMVCCGRGVKCNPNSGVSAAGQEKGIVCSRGNHTKCEGRRIKGLPKKSPPFMTAIKVI